MDKAIKSINIKLYTGTAAIDAAIVKLHKSGQRVQSEMHKLACSVLDHVGKHSDITVVGRFINAMPEMARKNALRNWFETFGPVVFGEGEQISFVKGKQTKLQPAMQKPFWKLVGVEGKPYEAIDVQAQVAIWIKKLRTDAVNTKRDHSALIHALECSVKPEPQSATVDPLAATQ